MLNRFLYLTTVLVVTVVLIAFKADAAEQSLISSDGTMIAFIASVPHANVKDESKLAVFLFDTKNRKCSLVQAFDDCSDLHLDLVGFSANGRYLAFASDSEVVSPSSPDIHIYDFTTRNLVSAKNKMSAISCVSSKGVIGGLPKVSGSKTYCKYCLFDFENRKMRQISITGNRVIPNSCFSDDGNFVAIDVIKGELVGENDSEVRVYKTDTSELLAAIKLEPSERRLCFSKDSSSLIIFDDKKLSAWSIPSGKMLWQDDFKYLGFGQKCPQYLSLGKESLAVYTQDPGSIKAPYLGTFVIAILDLRTGLIKNKIMPFADSTSREKLSIQLRPDDRTVVFVSEEQSKTKQWKQKVVRTEKVVVNFYGKRVERERQILDQPPIGSLKPGSHSHAKSDIYTMTPTGEKVLERAEAKGLEIKFYDANSKELVDEIKCSGEDIKLALSADLVSK